MKMEKRILEYSLERKEDERRLDEYIRKEKEIEKEDGEGAKLKEDLKESHPDIYDKLEKEHIDYYYDYFCGYSEKPKKYKYEQRIDYYMFEKELSSTSDYDLE
jgi:hypothetical protein